MARDHRVIADILCDMPPALARTSDERYRRTAHRAADLARHGSVERRLRDEALANRPCCASLIPVASHNSASDCAI